MTTVNLSRKESFELSKLSEIWQKQQKTRLFLWKSKTILPWLIKSLDKSKKKKKGTVPTWERADRKKILQKRLKKLLQKAETLAKDGKLSEAINTLPTVGESDTSSPGLPSLLQDLG